MKEYQTPALVAMDGLIEGVYAASGVEGNCWSISVEKIQTDEASGFINFRVVGVHTCSVQHISKGVSFNLLANYNVDSVSFESFDATCQGLLISLSRVNHANAYGSGDNFNTLLTVHPAAGTDYNAFSLTVVPNFVCDKTANVQGGMD